MKQEFDMVKALHTLTYDLESESGYFNMSRMYTTLLDRCANEAVKRFRVIEMQDNLLRTKKSKGSYVRDQWVRVDSDQRLFKRFRKMCKERYAHFFDMMLHGKQDFDMNYYVYFDPHAMGTELVDEFEEVLWDRL